MEKQIYLFFIFILNGFILGLLFDIFRIFRKSFKTNDLITYFQDVLFWILSGFIVLYSIFKFNNGEVRGYIFVGISIGAIIYLILFSKIFIIVNVFIINILKKIIYYILIIPIRTINNFLKKIIFKPISFIFINFKKNMSKLKLKPKKINKNNKKIEYKKDLM